MPAPKRGRGSHPAGWRVIDHAFPCSRPIGRRRSARRWMSGPTKAAAFGNEAALTSIGRCPRSEEHTSELQSLMRISYAVFCLKKKNKNKTSPPLHYKHIIITCNEMIHKSNLITITLHYTTV